jgi:hypothetical protein
LTNIQETDITTITQRCRRYTGRDRSEQVVAIRRNGWSRLSECAIDSGKDNDGVWVETWAFVITQKDRNTLITNLYRVVNNTDLPLNIDYSKFSSAKAGELKRVSR